MDRETEAERWMVIGQKGMEMRLMNELIGKQMGNELTNDGAVVTCCSSEEGFENSLFTLTSIQWLLSERTGRLDWNTK